MHHDIGSRDASVDVEVVPEKHLSNFVLGLKIAASDGYDALVGFVMYVAGHGGPLGNSFDMVGHDPSMIEIITKADLLHLKNKNFVRLITQAWQLILLDIGPRVDTFKFGDAIHTS